MLFYFLFTLARSEPTISISTDGNELIFGGTGSINQTFARSQGNFKTVRSASVDGPSVLETGAFENFNNLISINISDTVKTISANCFHSCISLVSFVFPKDITSIEMGIFENCVSLESVTLGQFINRIDTFLSFGGCSSISTFNVSPLNNYFTTDDSHSFLLSKNGTILYIGPATAQTIPNTVQTIFQNCYYSISVPSIDFSKSNITEILEYGFRQLTIDSLSFPKTLKRIQSYAFYQSQIRSISIPSSLTFFHEQALYDIYELDEMNVEDSDALVKKDGLVLNKAENHIFFIDKDIEHINISKTVTSIELYCIRKHNVLNVSVEQPNSAYSSFSGALYNPSYSTLIVSPGGKKTVEVHQKCTTLGRYSFYKCLVEEVRVSDKLEYVDPLAFTECKFLRSINFPIGLKKFYDYSFTECKSLNISHKFGPNFEYIGHACFRGVNLITLIDFSDCAKLTSISTEVFKNCELKEIKLPTVLTSLLDSSFSGSTIHSISLPDTLTLISIGCFSRCTYLSEISFGKSKITSIPESCFEATNITEIAVPPMVETLYQNCFKDSKELISVNFGEEPKISKIYSGIISGCSKLKNLLIPKSVTFISDGAFVNSNGLINFTTTEKSKEDVQKYISIEGILYTDEGTTIVAFPGGRTIANIKSGVKKINKLSFASCIFLESIRFEMGSQIIYFDANVFKGCESLRTVELPDSLERFDSTSFSECYNIEEINFTNQSSLTSIPTNAFIDRRKLRSFDFYQTKNLKIIGAQAFKNCYSLKETIFYNLTEIGVNSFSGCSSLLTISLPASISILGANCFSSCDKLHSCYYCGDKFMNNKLFESSFMMSAVYVKQTYENEIFGGLPIVRILDKDCSFPTVCFTEASQTISIGNMMSCIPMIDEGG